MKGSAVGRRYAKALLEVAEEQKQVPKVQKDLEDLLASWQESRDLRATFENPAFGPELRVKILDELAKRMSLSPLVANTLRLLSDRQRLRHLPEVVESFLALSQQGAGGVVAEVTTATELPETYFAKLQATLEKSLGKKVSIVKKVDPTLVAGVVTRIGDRVYDGSLASSLRKLEDRMLAP
ncbi:MAG: ATP synthase F1 subunit delta [Polyangiales bacterium]|nr:ATP synthase F1 subunit delta [Myxococcales bacterium]